jgi:glycosyltransferase involved in cell wall biosynthesis
MTIRDLYYFSPSTNFGVAAQSRFQNEVPLHFSDNDVVWQESVYLYAANQTGKSRFAKVVDLGCGSGVKLLNPGFKDIKRIQVDFLDARDMATMEIPFYSCDFQDYSQLDELLKTLTSAEPALFILSDVIEHLEDPRPLLRVLRILLRQNSNNRLIISTPDRARVSLINHPGPPHNRKHVREWTTEEFEEILLKSGFRLEMINHLPQNRFDEHGCTIVALVSCSEESYGAFLESIGIAQTPRLLQIATEHSKFSFSGGIGSYLESSEKNLPDKPLVLFVGNRGVEGDLFTTCQNVGFIHIRELVFAQFWPDENEIDYEKVLDAVQQLCYLIDTITLIEYQDYSGIGYRLGQGGAAGLLPKSITTICYCHGTNFYVEHGAAKELGNRNVLFDVRERIGIESADWVFFPSHFLKRLYLEFQNLKVENYRIVPYPITLEPLQKMTINYQQIDTLLFYGKASEHKGFFDFIDAINFMKNNNSEYFQQIKRIILAGVTRNELTESMKQIFPFEFFKGTRQQARQLLQENSTRSLVILPYKADNQPIAVYEVIEAGCRFLAYNAGGIPEQIPTKFHDQALIPPNCIEIVRGIARCLDESGWERSSLIQQLYDTVQSQQNERVRSFASNLLEIESTNLLSKPHIKAENLSWKITAVFDLSGLSDEEVVSELNLLLNFTTRPHYILAIVDEPVSNFFENVIAEYSELYGINLQFKLYPKGKNVSELKNSYLDSIESEYVIFLHKNTLLSNNYFKLAKNMLDKKSLIATVLPFIEITNNLRERNTQLGHEPTVRYSSSSLVELFSKVPHIDLPLLWRKSALTDIGGFHITTRNEISDRLTLLRLIAGGMEIPILPTTMIRLYVKEGVTVEKYPLTAFDCREIMNTLGFPRNEWFELARILSGSHHITHTSDIDHTTGIVGYPHSNFESMYRELINSKSWRITRPLRNLRAALITLRNKFR